MTAPFPFFSGFTTPRWRALWAAMFGYLLDAMDVLLFVFAVQVLKSEFSLTNAQAGVVTSVTLIASAAGGVAAGVLADRIGRCRTLMLTILTYSIASGLAATSTGLGTLVFWRAMVGLGLGGEWSAGAVLVSESWPSEHRVKATAFMQSGWALGYMTAAVVSAVILPRFGWRALFLVGVLPAVLTLFIRRNVEEPVVWRRAQTAGRSGRFGDLFTGRMGRKTLLAVILTAATMFAYWGLFTWLPGFLSAPRAAGGAGMTLVSSSLWIFLMQGGAFAGYLTFGTLADRLGRRRVFAFYMLMAGLLTPLYGSLPQLLGDSAETALLLVGPLVGFFGTGYFSMFGAMLAELFPTAIRGTGQGFTYNTGRGISALAPYVIGAAADRAGIGPALGISAGFFLAAGLLVFTLPETRSLEE